MESTKSQRQSHPSKSFKISLKLENPIGEAEGNDRKIVVKEFNTPKASSKKRQFREKVKLKKTKKIKSQKRKEANLLKKATLKQKKLSSRSSRRKIKKLRIEAKQTETSSVSVCSSKVQKSWSFRWVPFTNVFEHSCEVWLRRWVRRELISCRT